MTKAEVSHTRHKTVLLQETIEGLNLKSNSIVLDCTFGGGGHSLEICKRFPDTKIIALDQDKSVWGKDLDIRCPLGHRMSKSMSKSGCNISFHNANFRDLDRILEKEKISEVDGIIFDLGLSSDQLEVSGRGFSFLKDEPLLMTMKENPTVLDVTAQDVVNQWGESSLADVIYGYGEEKQARRIAKEIVEFRKKQKIKTTFDLVKIIEKAIPAKFRKGRIHFATKTFQAIRIAVNDELGALTEGLDKGFKLLKVGGRMAVISFHSLEDRIVKKFYKGRMMEGTAKLINKKVIVSGANEIKNNPKSRSAKLRILEKI